MQHHLAGIQRAALAHIRAAAVVQRSLAQMSISDLAANHQDAFSKTTAEKLAGAYRRARESAVVLAAALTDCRDAIGILEGKSLTSSGEFGNMAFNALSASYEARQSATLALKALEGDLSEALAQANELLPAIHADAQTSLTKGIAADALDIKSLHIGNGFGVGMLKGSLAEKHLPAAVGMGLQQMTAEGTKRLAGYVLADYKRMLDDEKILKSEYEQHDAKVVKAALKARAVAALAALGKGE